MADGNKPFLCKFTGCGMSFTNEDHLMVHKKKHEMSLTLGSHKANAFVADQTPTPTRFIRNCEEVGLFQDLQNVNPFEEQFRKATEGTYKKLSTTQQSGVLGDIDDVLHTPHVFPIIDNDNNSIIALTRNKKSLSLCPPPTIIVSPSSPSPPPPPPHTPTPPPPSHITIQEGRNEEKQKGTSLAKCGRKRKLSITGKRSDQDAKAKVPLILPAPVNPQSENNNTVQLLLRIPDGRLVQLSALPVVSNNETSTTSSQSTTFPSASSATKYKLKQTLTRNLQGKAVKRFSTSHTVKGNASSNRNTALMLNKVNRQTTNDFENKMINSHTDIQNKSFLVPEENVERRKKFLERNRAAASRCREKRKKWIGQLECKAEELNAMNQHLQAEVANLRAEVANLKTLLLAHKDCPVTLAMQQGDTSDNETFYVTQKAVQKSLARKSKSIAERPQQQVLIVNPLNNGIIFPVNTIPTTNEQLFVSTQPSVSKQQKKLRPCTVSVPIVSSTTSELNGLLQPSRHIIQLSIEEPRQTSLNNSCSINNSSVPNIVETQQLHPTDEDLEIII